eukprot:TRINITY_DN49674_c0_g1_i1.p1 TRINITY_DN49674_c0_g1~~TRINITY_DN49674_c0_g1_i1.p1  ORF type:complete len:212 (-),score=22.10 TRINITY_DN49674_c0_g1_i1:55-690(-)
MVPPGEQYSSAVQPIVPGDSQVKRLPAPWLPVWANVYSAEGNLWLSGGEQRQRRENISRGGLSSRGSSRGGPPAVLRAGREDGGGKQIPGTPRSARDVNSTKAIQQLRPPRGVHPKDDGALCRQRFRGGLAANAVPNYSGHIPGKHADNVFGLTFRNANTRAVVDEDSTNRTGVPFLRTLPPVRLSAADVVDAPGQFNAEGRPKPTSMYIY